MSVTVRPAHEDEYDAVGALTAAAYAVDGLTAPDYLEVLRDVRSRAEVADVLVAVDDAERILGTVTLVPPDAPPEWRETSREDTATVRMLGVAAATRGLGVGTRLAQECVTLARSRGWRALILHTQPKMLAAQRIYERLGFVRDPALDWSPRPGVDLIGYSMRL